MIKNRKKAGEKLAELLIKKIEKTPIVLAIPRGGVVVGKEIAKKLNCQMDVIISKKITPPNHPEYAIGAIAHDGTTFLRENWSEYLSSSELEKQIEKGKIEVKKRLEEFRGSAKYEISQKTVILVDDGIATGATALVLIKWLSNQESSKIILATPVISARTYENIKPLVDELVAIEIPVEFNAVGQFFENFEEVSNSEVIKILKES